MKSTSSFKRGLARIRRAWLAKKFDRAFAEVDALLKEWPDNPHLLVLWADLIQLQETEEGPTLEDAEAAYRRARELNGESPEPHVGLGHYLYAVQDDTKGAIPCFAKAIALGRSWLRATLLAQADALAELGRQQEAFDCLAEAHWLQRYNGKDLNGTSAKEILDRLNALSHAG